MVITNAIESTIMMVITGITHRLATVHACLPASGIHQAGVCLQAALYCLEEQEGPLLQYLASARDLLGRPLYDPQTALRLARQRNKLQASVQLLCDLNLYEVSHRQPDSRTCVCMCTALQAPGRFTTN